MLKHYHIARCAAVAIAASAAIPATSVLAQDATIGQPTIVLPSSTNASPTVTGATTPAPVLTVPEPVTQTAPQRIVLPEPVAPVTVDQSEAKAAPVAKNAKIAKAPEPKAVQSAAEPVRAEIEPVTQTNPVPVAPVTPGLADPMAQRAVPAMADTASVPADNSLTATIADDGNDAIVAGMAGVIGLLVVGGIAFAATRRRLPAPINDDVVVTEYRDESFARPTPVVSPTPSVSYAPPESNAAPAMATKAAPSPWAKDRTDPIVLPERMPESYEERDALLKRLVNAKPDRANPFRSRGARARRARLIIQSLDRNFEKVKPRIDLSQYTDRWPALRGWSPATA